MAMIRVCYSLQDFIPGRSILRVIGNFEFALVLGTVRTTISK